MPREGFGRRLPADPAIVEQVSRDPTMLAEQGAGFMQDWGGAQAYQQMAQAPIEAREVYYAVIDGFSDPSQIAVVTGLSDKEVSGGLSWLGRKGLVFQEVV